MSQTRSAPKQAAFPHSTIGGVMVDIALIAFVLGVLRASLVVGALNALVLLLAVVRARRLGRRREAMNQPPTLRDRLLDLGQSYLCAFALIASVLVTLLMVTFLSIFVVGPMAPLPGILAAGFVGYWVGGAIWPGWPRSRGPEIVWVGEVIERPQASRMECEGEPLWPRDEPGSWSSGVAHLD